MKNNHPKEAKVAQQANCHIGRTDGQNNTESSISLSAILVLYEKLLLFLDVFLLLLLLLSFHILLLLFVLGGRSGSKNRLCMVN